MKRNRYLRILWAVTILCVIGGLYWNLVERPRRNYEYYEEPYAYEEYGDYEVPDEEAEYATDRAEAMDVFREVRVEDFVGEVAVQAGDMYYWEYTGNRADFRAEITNQDGVLEVRQSKPENKLQWENGNGGTLIITVPYGDAVSLDITVNAGTVRLEQLISDNCTITNNMGNVSLHECELAQAAIIVRMGALDAYTLSYGDFTVEMDMGDVNIETINETRRGEIELRTELGRTTYNGEDMGTSWTMSYGGEGTSTMRIHNRMGNINITGMY